jgi:signal transduction histidine kinase
MNILSDNITRKMPSGLLTVDRKGIITGFNPASERIFKGTLRLKLALPDLVHESDALRALLEKCLTTGEIFTRVEFNVPVAPDTDKRIGINLSPFSDAKGQIEGAICLLSDLTEIVDLQNQIKLKENFAALGEMSAGIAHEFKNALATILGYAQMSMYESDINVVHAYAREINKESQGLAVMVTDFLNFARPLKATTQEVDLEELLSTVIADLRNLRPGPYEVTFKATTDAVVACDATLIRQTFLNLLINAVESLSDAQGKLTVLIERAHRGHLRVTVEDTGRGIANHQLPKIFLPFFTTKTHGTGLGLALVQKIVLAHNGRIEVQSTEGKGTRFAITLPRLTGVQASERV